MGWNPILAIPDYLDFRAKGALPPPPTANLLLWMDGDNTYVFSDTGGTTPATDGGSIGSWRDRGPSAYLFTQATAGNQPRFDENEIGGEDAVFFGVGATKDYLVLATPISPAAGDSSFYMVIQPENLAASKQVIHGGEFFGSNGYGIIVLSDQKVSLEKTGAGSVADSQSPLPTDKFTVVSVLHDNGTDVNFRFNSQSEPAVLAGAVTFNATGNTRLGAKVSATAVPFQGHIAELLLYDTLHSDDERNQIEAYLQKKYGIVAGADAGFDTGFDHGFG